MPSCVSFQCPANNTQRPSIPDDLPIDNKPYRDSRAPVQCCCGGWSCMRIISLRCLTFLATSFYWIGLNQFFNFVEPTRKQGLKRSTMTCISPMQQHLTSPESFLVAGSTMQCPQLNQDLQGRDASLNLVQALSRPSYW